MYFQRLKVWGNCTIFAVSAFSRQSMIRKYTCHATSRPVGQHAGVLLVRYLDLRTNGSDFKPTVSAVGLMYVQVHLNKLECREKVHFFL